MAAAQVCPGCGSRFPEVDGPTHSYMSSSPACWAAFNTVMAREYSNPALMSVHRLSVDTWAIQHPGNGSRQAIQSVGLHLARLLVQIEETRTDRELGEAMLGFVARKSELPKLPARTAYTMTVADVVDAVAPDDHQKAVRRWADATWRDWADQHDFIRNWASASQDY